MRNILITTGGTGGHIYPALVVADKLKNEGDKIIFVGSMHRMEKELIPKNSYTFYGLDIFPLKSFMSIIKLFKGIYEVIKIIRKEKIEIVIGFGNYISLPSLIAAKILRKKIYLQEQNVTMGLANKVFYPFCEKIFLAFGETSKFIKEKHKSKIVVSGNPIREVFYNISKEKAREILNISMEEKVIVIMGGSLGAKNINEEVLKNLDLFNFENIHLFWSTGKNLYKEVIDRAEESEKIVIVPYFEEPHILMAASDIILARAGALTISEIIQLEKPSILIPYDGVGQLENAESLEIINASKIYNNSEVKKAIQESIKLVKDEDTLKFMTENIKKIKPPRADLIIIKNLKK